MLYDQTHLLVPLVSEEFALLGHHHQCWDSLHLGTKKRVDQDQAIEVFYLEFIVQFLCQV